jgi:benzoyl-CoA reductase/2-hydroxyglutaryl-CoA dehydratase subunit BcrC/BadD/HgdB
VKTVVYNSPFVPAEWIAAHGLRPRRVRPDPAAAAPSTGPLTGMCPYARAFVGEVASGARAAVFTTTCDQMRRAAEWAGRLGGPPVFLMNVPATWQTAVSARLYRDELRRLGGFLVRLGGAAPSREHLAETMEAFDGRRAVLRGYAGALGARLANEALARFGLGEEHDVRAPAVPAAPRGTAVALIGGPLMRGDAGVFDAIEKAGGLAVLDGTETGLRTLPAPFDRRRLRDDPLMELVDAYFGTIPDAFRRPDAALYRWLARELAASAARGIIMWRYLWCDMWAASVTRLRETSGLPVLDLDVLGDEAGLARTANRIQAFLEVLA